MVPAPNPSGEIHKIFPLLLIFLWEYFGMTFFFPFCIYPSTLCSCSFWCYISSLCFTDNGILISISSCSRYLWIILREGTCKEMSFTSILRLKIAPLWSLLLGHYQQLSFTSSELPFYLVYIFVLLCFTFIVSPYRFLCAYRHVRQEICLLLN